jgi:hypothetical protein
LNIGPPACKASTLPTELYVQPLDSFFFLTQISSNILFLICTGICLLYHLSHSYQLLKRHFNVNDLLGKNLVWLL